MPTPSLLVLGIRYEDEKWFIATFWLLCINNSTRGITIPGHTILPHSNQIYNGGKASLTGKIGRRESGTEG